MLAAAGTFLFIIFYTSGFDSHHDAEMHNHQDFVEKTKNAMDSAAAPPGKPVLNADTGEKAGHIPADKDADGDVDDDDRQMASQMQERLKAAEQVAKDKANEKGGMRPDPPSNVIGVGSSQEGQADKKEGKVDKVAGAGGAVVEEEKPLSKEEREAREELNVILKKSPGKLDEIERIRSPKLTFCAVIIFSKSYCPFSKRAKGLLLEKYSIIPEPHVVELDEHPMGSYLQDQLLEMTGRRTVPNIMVNGVSIGGADDIIDMDNADKLVGKIVDLGSNRVEVSERFIAGGSGQ